MFITLLFSLARSLCCAKHKRRRLPPLALEHGERRGVRELREMVHPHDDSDTPTTWRKGAYRRELRRNTRGPSVPSSVVLRTYYEQGCFFLSLRSDFEVERQRGMLPRDGRSLRLQLLATRKRRTCIKAER